MSGFLFAYGTLIPRNRLGLDREGWVPDAVRGRLYDLGAYPVLVDLGDPTAMWVEGYVRPVEVEELNGPLDRYEEVERGLFRRVQTTTRTDRTVWLYVYCGPLPEEKDGPLERWPGLADLG